MTWRVWRKFFFFCLINLQIYVGGYDFVVVVDSSNMCIYLLNGFMISNRRSASERLTSKLHEGEVCNNESYKTILNWCLPTETDSLSVSSTASKRRQQYATKIKLNGTSVHEQRSSSAVSVLNLRSQTHGQKVPLTEQRIQ